MDLLESSKKTYEVFRPLDQNGAKCATYAICVIIRVVENIKKRSMRKEVTKLSIQK